MMFLFCRKRNPSTRCTSAFRVHRAKRLYPLPTPHSTRHNSHSLTVPSNANEHISQNSSVPSAEAGRDLLSCKQTVFPSPAPSLPSFYPHRRALRSPNIPPSPPPRAPATQVTPVLPHPFKPPPSDRPSLPYSLFLLLPQPNKQTTPPTPQNHHGPIRRSR